MIMTGNSYMHGEANYYPTDEAKSEFYNTVTEDIDRIPLEEITSEEEEENIKRHSE